MPVDINDLRSLAVLLPGVEESLSHGTPAFYIRGKLLARLQEDGESVSLGCARVDRDDLIERFPDTFFVTDHFLNYDYILASLPSANLDIFRKVFESAWRRKAGKREVAALDATRSKEPNK
jgi:hypothetical protein